MKRGNINDRQRLYRITQRILYLTNEPDYLLGLYVRVIGHGSPELADVLCMLTDENGKPLTREELRQHLAANNFLAASLDSCLGQMFEPIRDDQEEEVACVEYMWESISPAI